MGHPLALAETLTLGYHCHRGYDHALFDIDEDGSLHLTSPLANQEPLLPRANLEDLADLEDLTSNSNFHLS